MSQFIELIKHEYSLNSIIFYIVIINLAILFSFLSQWSGLKKQKGTDIINLEERYKNNLKYIQIVFFCISFFVLWFTSAFADCGTDREAYALIFENVSWADLISGWQEPGFILFNMFFRIFGSNPRIIYVAISTATLGLLFLTWRRLRNDILVVYGVLAYTTLSFVQSLSLMRIYLASAILFSGIEYLRKRKYGFYIIIIGIATLIHYSSLLILIPYLILFLLENHKYKQYVHIISVVVGLCLIFLIVFFASPLFQNIPIFARFQSYIDNISFSGIGLMQFVYNLPICGIAYLGYKYETNIDDKRIIVAYTSSAFLLSMLSYGVPVLGRALSLFTVLYLFVVPRCMTLLKDHLSGTNRYLYTIIKVLCFIYFIMRFSIYIGEYYELDGIIPYVNVLF